MGFSHSWIAVQGLTTERAIEALGFEIEEIREPEDMTADGLYVGAMPNGWLIALTDRQDNAFESPLVDLAKFGPAVACEVNERVMYSEARGYDANAETWRVIYDCEDGPEALKIEGNPPPQFDKIQREAKAEQEDDDGVDVLFEIPALLARSICGYMLGENEPEGFRYIKLRRAGAPSGDARPKGPGFLSRLFGRG